MSIADVFFALGRTHSVCQDYGVAESPDPTDPDGRSKVIVCDGCSSSPDTDTGARLLARAALSAGPFDVNKTVIRAKGFAEALDIPLTALDATLILLRETETKDAEVIMYGDGVVVGRRRDGSGYDYWVVTYSHNAPGYLSYLTSPSRMAEYMKAGGLRRVSGVSTAPECDWTLVPPLGLAEAPADPSIPIIFGFPRDIYDIVVVLSDGAESFQQRGGNQFFPVSVRDVLDQILDFKVLTPGFVRRRLGKFLRVFCEANGWLHTDDLCVGAIILDPPGSNPITKA